MGEGAAVLILEDEEKARARGAKILGYIRGFGADVGRQPHDRAREERRGCDEGDPARVGRRGQDRRGRRVRQRARHVDAAQRPRGDRARSRRRWATTPRPSRSPRPKSAIGHLLGAAGAVETVATILALRDRMAPPTLNYGEPEEGHGPRLRSQRGQAAGHRRTSRRSRSPTRSGSAATTSCLLWRPHDSPAFRRAGSPIAGRAPGGALR